MVQSKTVTTCINQIKPVSTGLSWPQTESTVILYCQCINVNTTTDNSKLNSLLASVINGPLRPILDNWSVDIWLVRKGKLNIEIAVLTYISWILITLEFFNFSKLG